jgi:hypothetical protein
MSGEHSVLTTRGWVLQESLLSPRTLHFGSEQMFWECPNMRLAEGDFSPLTTKSPVTNDVDLGASKQLFNVNVLGNRGQAEVVGLAGQQQACDLWYQRWYRIVANYSERNLGYPSDIFPALSGLAQTVGTLTGDEYMAGLFRRDACRGLLWSPTDKAMASRAHPYRAPSWSWASIMGPVEFAIRPNQYTLILELIAEHNLTVVNVSLCSLHEAGRSKGVYGALTSAALEVEGFWRDGVSWEKVEKSNKDDTRWDFVYGDDLVQADFVFDVKSDSFDPRLANDWALLQVSMWVRTAAVASVDELYALILRPVEGGSGEVLFRRVGLCTFKTIDEPLESVMRVPWDRKRVALV